MFVKIEYIAAKLSQIKRLVIAFNKRLPASLDIFSLFVEHFSVSFHIYIYIYIYINLKDFKSKETLFSLYFKTLKKKNWNTNKP